MRGMLITIITTTKTIIIFIYCYIFRLAWGLVYMLIMFVVTLVVTVIRFLFQFLPNSSPVLFFLCLYLYGLTIITMAFAITPFFNKAEAAGMSTEEYCTGVGWPCGQVQCPS